MAAQRKVALLRVVFPLRNGLAPLEMVTDSLLCCADYPRVRAFGADGACGNR